MRPTPSDSELIGLRRTFRSLADVSDDALGELVARTTRKAFSRGSWLLRGGDRAEWCFFISKGLVRELYIDESGEEHTRRFQAEGQVTGSLLDLLSPGPSVTWIQALEEVHTIAWRYPEFDALCRRFRDLDTAARRSAEALYVFKTRREHELLALPASERHARWLRDHPELDARVSRRHLASYLGITPEHLSRLRRATPASLVARRRVRR